LHTHIYTHTHTHTHTTHTHTHNTHTHTSGCLTYGRMRENARRSHCYSRPATGNGSPPLSPKASDTPVSRHIPFQTKTASSAKFPFFRSSRHQSRSAELWQTDSDTKHECGKVVGNSLDKCSWHGASRYANNVISKIK